MKENRSYLPRESHLPLYGVGPVYVAVIITVTMAGILLSQFKIIAYLSFSMIKMDLLKIGALLIAAGAALWVLAVFDGADEMYRGKVAEKFIRCGI